MRKHILVVDDSAVVRRYLSRLLEKEGYEVQSASNGEEALKKHLQTPFSLITLDIEMPVMDGIETLRRIMQERPTRVLMVSALTTEQADITLQALHLGAIDYIPKPQNSVEVAKISNEIVRKVKTTLMIPLSRLAPPENKPLTTTPRDHQTIQQGFVLIGASTGGPRLIEHICRILPSSYPHPVCIVQHMPKEFTATFARRLNSLCDVEVLEADNGIVLQPGMAVIAKGGWHLHFRRHPKGFQTRLAPNTKNRFFVPSVDEMFFSAVEVLPPEKILAIELTGIGDDGADGMVALRKAGAYTIAESENTAVVYGMPKEAAERGGAVKVLDFDDIVEEIIRYGRGT